MITLDTHHEVAGRHAFGMVVAAMMTAKYKNALLILKPEETLEAALNHAQVYIAVPDGTCTTDGDDVRGVHCVKVVDVTGKTVQVSIDSYPAVFNLSDVSSITVI